MGVASIALYCIGAWCVDYTYWVGLGGKGSDIKMDGEEERRWRRTKSSILFCA
jgi:hypothetical protein